MSAPSGKAGAAPLSPTGYSTPSARQRALIWLLSDYRQRRAQIETRLSERRTDALLCSALRLQARTLDMVIDDLEALIEGEPGRFGCD